MTLHPRALLPLLAVRPAGGRLMVAFSGGLDSHVLLHAVASLRNGLPPDTVFAVHVDHGLSPNAAAWSRHCAAVCAGLSVPCRAVTVDARPRRGEGPEAAARRARYAALAGAMAPGDCLLTAHHRGDQAETVLLQLLRGAGPHGTAAMAARAPFAGGLHLRPLLDYPRAALRAYAAAHGLRWVEDESNADLRLRRNYVRHEVLPRLRAHWPGAEAALARAAGHHRDAAEVLDETAAADLAVAAAGEGIAVAALERLSPARRRNLLRYWLRQCGLPAPAAAHMHQIEAALLDAAPDRVPLVSWPGAQLRRYRGLLYALHPRAAAAPPDGAAAWAALSQPLALPGGGRLHAEACSGAGVSARACEGGVTVRFRRGGERCRPSGSVHQRTLKNLFQERGVPPWERDRVPLVCIGGAIAAVGDYWVCAPFGAAPGERGVAFRWERA